MFLKSLIISSPTKTIREIIFRKGINLIVDESEGEHITGNNVGKTTVLKLIDFCLGAKAKIIYEDPESKKDINRLVKDFLLKEEVLITLILTENLDNDKAKKVIIERNFISRGKKVIRKINGIPYVEKNKNGEKEFELKLKELLFSEHKASKPTLRQIISHNIRYSNLSI